MPAPWVHASLEARGTPDAGRQDMDNLHVHPQAGEDVGGFNCCALTEFPLCVHLPAPVGTAAPALVIGVGRRTVMRLLRLRGALPDVSVRGDVSPAAPMVSVPVGGPF